MAERMEWNVCCCSVSLSQLHTDYVEAVVSLMSIENSSTYRQCAAKKVSPKVF